jgi:hypothetical protein
MNTPSWEAGGWTALVGGNPIERIGRSRVSDMAGSELSTASLRPDWHLVTRVGVSTPGGERVSISF